MLLTLIAVSSVIVSSVIIIDIFSFCYILASTNFLGIKFRIVTWCPCLYLKVKTIRHISQAIQDITITTNSSCSNSFKSNVKRLKIEYSQQSVPILFTRLRKYDRIFIYYKFILKYSKISIPKRYILLLYLPNIE